MNYFKDKDLVRVEATYQRAMKNVYKRWQSTDTEIAVDDHIWLKPGVHQRKLILEETYPEYQTLQLKVSKSGIGK